MYILNTTFVIAEPLSDEFIEWASKTWCERAISSGIFQSPTIALVMHTAEPGTKSYAVGFKTDDLELAQTWLDNDGEALLAHLSCRYGENMLWFHTFMQLLQAK